jgi:hypothetical protein
MQFLVCLWFKDPVNTSDYMLSNGRITDELSRTTPLIPRNISGKTFKKSVKNIGLVGDLVKFRTSIPPHMESNTFCRKFGKYHNHLSTQDVTETKLGDKPCLRGKKT